MVRVSLPTFVLLLFALLAVAVVMARYGDILARKRREWIIPPKPLEENKDYTKEEFVARIRSDFEDDFDIDYSLEGPGANQYPFHVFVVDRATGKIRVTKILDREDIAMYNLSGVATKKNGDVMEKNIEIRIKVTDVNDNSPVFGVTQIGSVYELRKKGTTVMKITATDADEPGNENSQIAYSILSQNPDHDMFGVHSDGTIYIKRHDLDRERQDKYTLTVQGQDLNGKKGGNTGTGTVVINVLDVNDHAPTLEKTEYEGSIEENTKGVEVMRLKVNDEDLKGTENWEAVFNIVKGNEAGYFSISTDPKTNDGILMLDKEVDYEDVKELDLGITVQNKVPLYDGSDGISAAGIDLGGGGVGAAGSPVGTGGAGSAGGAGGATGASGATGATGASSGTGGSSWQSTSVKSYPVKITVKNQPEGPKFDPKVKAIPISEEHIVNIQEVISIYPAIDGDTRKPAKNVKYAKGTDPDNWLIIDPETAEIRLNKQPDRESPYLVNGTYLAEVLCISEDMLGKTATGTIAIQVEDFNDNCPTLTSNVQNMCTEQSSVIVNAKDEDASPNGPPLHYEIIPEGTKGKWRVERLNDTAAVLRAEETMWPGLYEVEFSVTDQQGHYCPDPQKVTIQVCTCEDGVVCGIRGTDGQISTKRGSEFGPAGIGLLLLGALLLLLLPLLLLFCQCGGLAGMPNFAEMPFDTKSHLINYHTEGQGENTEVPLVNVPSQQVDIGTAHLVTMPPMGAMDFGQNSFASVDGINGAFYQKGFSAVQGEGTWGMANQFGRGVYSEFEGRESRVGGSLFDGMALPDHFLREYYTQKVASGNENLGVKDGLLVYDSEGQGSPAGSVGCCSLLESDNDLQFLDDLGPKFKTLAEVCGGKKITTEVKSVFTPPTVKPVFTPPPTTSINTQSSTSSVVTTQKLPLPPQLQMNVDKKVETVVRETSEHSKMVNESMATMKQGMTTVNTGIANQGQMLLLQQQQPVYYTTTPMMQPMHYVVQPQVQNTMLLAEAPATNLQGMVLVNGTQTAPAQGVVVQGQTLMSSGQAQGMGMMLVGNSGIQGGNLIHTGNLSGSKTMMVMEGNAPAGSVKVLKGSKATLVKGGTLPAGGLSGSQKVLVVGGPVSNGGQLVQEAGGLSQKSDISGSQRMLYSKGSTSSGSRSNVVSSSTTTVNTTPTYHKVVTQETREISS